MLLWLLCEDELDDELLELLLELGLDDELLEELELDEEDGMEGILLLEELWLLD